VGAASPASSRARSVNFGMVRASLVISGSPLAQCEPSTGRKDCSGKPIWDSPSIDGPGKGEILSRQDVRICPYYWGAISLSLRHGGRQSAGGAGGLETDLSVGAVAERFVLGLTAAAEADGFAAREVERVAVHVVNGKVSFDAYRAVVADGDFRWHFSDRSTAGRRPIIIGNI